MSIDKSLFPRLLRIFSTDVVIRSVGGKKLKVSDVERVMAVGNIQTNSLVDRFTRLHRGAYGQTPFNPTMNYQTLRLQLYSDYDAMDTDGIIAAVLDILSEESTLKGETNEVLTIRSNNENIQSILYNLFYDILNIEFNLPMWIRSMCKYGDAYLSMEIAEEFGVYNVKPLPHWAMVREEGTDPDNPSYIKFVYDPIALAGGNAASRNKKSFENYEIAHFRLLKDSNYLPYGRSYLEPARKLFKQLTLLEDAMLLHRIMRAPEKRVFYINVGNIPPNEVNAFVQNTINQMKKAPFIDTQTGDYNLKFNVQNMVEDFYIPVRPGDNTTKIETAKGLEYAGIEDIEYIRDKMLASLKVPKAFLNYSDELNGKSTISALDLRFARTVEYIQRIVLSELKKIAQIHLYVQGYEDDMSNFELDLNNPSIIYEQERIALLKEKVGLATDIAEKKIFSTDYVYDKIFELSEDQVLEQRDLILEDVMRLFRYSQIETEGNDPSESGVSFGTPHDLATVYNRNAKGEEQDVPDGYDENDTAEPGRPKEKASIFKTDKDPFGRDPLGQKGMKDKGEDGALTYKHRPSAMALEAAKDPKRRKLLQKGLGLDKYKPKQVLLYEQKEEDEGLLSEKNILEDLTD